MMRIDAVVAIGVDQLTLFTSGAGKVTVGKEGQAWKSDSVA